MLKFPSEPELQHIPEYRRQQDTVLHNLKYVILSRYRVVSNKYEKL